MRYTGTDVPGNRKILEIEILAEGLHGHILTTSLNRIAVDCITISSDCALQLTSVCNATETTSSEFSQEMCHEAQLSFLRKLCMHARDEGNSSCRQLRRTFLN